MQTPQVKEETFSRAYLVFSYVPKGKRKPARFKPLVEEAAAFTEGDTERLTLLARAEFAIVARIGAGLTSRPTSKPALVIYAGCSASESPSFGRMVFEPMFPAASFPFEA